MLGNDTFFFDTIRKFIIIFGSLFDNLVINRTDSSGNLTEMINVPIHYADKEKMLERVTSDPDIDRQTSIVLPAMSFEWIDMAPRPQDKAPQINKFAFGNTLTQTSINFMYTEAPFDFHFNLHVYTKNNMDMNKILEQILPFFSPSFTVKANLMTNMQSRDIPIIFHGITMKDENNEDFKQRKIMVYTLSFTVRGMLFGPQRKSPVINFANVSYYAQSAPAGNCAIFEYGLQNPYEDEGIEPVFTTNTVTSENNNIFSVITTGTLSNT